MQVRNISLNLLVIQFFDLWGEGGKGVYKLLLSFLSAVSSSPTPHLPSVQNFQTRNQKIYTCRCYGIFLWVWGLGEWTDAHCRVMIFCRVVALGDKNIPWRGMSWGLFWRGGFWKKLKKSGSLIAWLGVWSIFVGIFGTERGGERIFDYADTMPWICGSKNRLVQGACIWAITKTPGMPCMHLGITKTKRKQSLFMLSLRTLRVFVWE